MPYKRIIIYIFFLFVGNSLCAQQQKAAEVDSVVMAYYQKCLRNTQDPIVLSMADTLFRMAGDEGDERMQAVALCSKLDYYYYSRHENKKDSIMAWVERIQSFARETNQPKYYYFVWTSRVVNYYLRQGEYNIALLEVEKALKSAEMDDYKEGIADCYLSLSNIYISKMLPEMALDAVKKEIELSEKYDLERYNISSRYAVAARLLIFADREEEAVGYLEKAKESVQNVQHEVNAKLVQAEFYIRTGQLHKAGKLLSECQQKFETDKSLWMHLNTLYPVEVDYYLETKEYNKALRSIALHEELLRQKGDKPSIPRLYKAKADVYWAMNQKDSAANLYKLSLEELEKVKVDSEEKAIAEFATLLDMQRLSDEKNELEELSQKRLLYHAQTILISLLVILTIVIVFFYRQRLLNRRLVRSAAILNDKNRTLIRKEKELKEARDRAEKNSRMKTRFIQNMSHEIRTPLNSIVGFSAVLSEIFSGENEELKLCAKNIEQNSLLLIKIIHDILSISDLDDPHKPVDYKPVCINDCCLRAIEEIRPLLADKVTLSFTPSPDDPVIESNEELIMHVLRNLLSNAVKFTSSGEVRLDFEIDKDRNELQFVVADTGIGIPVDQHQLVFDRFVKLDDFTQGTGLGLSISRLAAERLGGYIVIDSKYTQGSRFVFGVPLR